MLFIDSFFPFLISIVIKDYSVLFSRIFFLNFLFSYSSSISFFSTNIYYLLILYRTMFLHLTEHNYSSCFKVCDNFNTLVISRLEFIGNLSDLQFVHNVSIFPAYFIYIFLFLMVFSNVMLWCVYLNWVCWTSLICWFIVLSIFRKYLAIISPNMCLPALFPFPHMILTEHICFTSWYGPMGPWDCGLHSGNSQ